MTTMTLARPFSLRSPRALAMAALGTVYILWGSTYLAIRWAEVGLPPFLMAGMRHVTAGGIILAWLLHKGVPLPRLREWKAPAVVGALLLLLGNGGVVFAETRIPSGVTALVVATVPLWMMVFGWISGRRPGRMGVVGLAIGFLGTCLLMAPGAGPSQDFRGLAVVVMASLAWAAGSIYAAHADLPALPLLATAMEMLTGGPLLLLASLGTGEMRTFHPSAVPATAWAAMAYLIVFGSLVGFSCYTWLLKNVSSELVATYAYVNPVVALALGTLLGGEVLTGRTVVAGVIVLASVVLIVRQRRPAPAEANCPDAQ